MNEGLKKQMKHIFIFTALAVVALVALPVGSPAQTEEMCPGLRSFPKRHRNQIDDTAIVREQLIKLCIKENKKEFEELVERAEEIEKLSDELKTSFDETSSFSESDREKLEQLESLIKKVRKELRATDDDEDEDVPKTVSEAVVSLHLTASDLAKDIKKTSRYSISLAAVRNSNTALKIVKFLRNSE